MSDIIRIANCSGYYGDRLDAAREMVEGGPIDVLTGDYLAELTMSILFNQRRERGERRAGSASAAAHAHLPSSRRRLPRGRARAASPPSGGRPSSR